MLKGQRYDICIVGAGVAGALVATAAVRRGLRVVMLDAGRRFDFSDRHNQIRRWEILGEDRWPWQHGARDRFVDSSTNGIGHEYSLNSFRVKAVGGSTLHWGGMALRLRESDFETATRYGRGIDWPISYRDLEPYYMGAEAELGVAGTPNPTDPPRSGPYPMEGFPSSWDDAIWRPVAKRMELDLEIPAHARNSRPYRGRSACVAYAVCNICPSGARYSADFHVLEAEASGRCTLLAETVARRIEHDRLGRVRAVHASGLDGTEYEITASRYVIAAHAVETARLLLLSGIGNHADQVGRNLMEHWHVGASGLLAERRFFPDRIGFTTLRCSSYYEGPERRHRGAMELEFATGRDPLLDFHKNNRFGRQFADHECATWGHELRVFAETEQQPNPESRVTLDPLVTDVFGDPVPHVHLTLKDIDRATQRQAREKCAELLEAVGARGIRQPQKLYPARHQMGTCRMSADPDQGVVDPDCRVHGTTNLYLAGSSVFPTCGARQPTLTIAALALRLADHLLKGQVET